MLTIFTAADSPPVCVYNMMAESSLRCRGDKESLDQKANLGAD